MIGNALRLRATNSAPVGQQQYITAGSGNFVVPAGVTSICVVVIGGGAGTTSSVDGVGPSFGGGSSGALCYKNNITVTPGQSIAYAVGGAGSPGSNGTASSFSIPSGTMTAGGGVVSGTTPSSSGGDVNRFGGPGFYTNISGGTIAKLGEGGRAFYDTTNASSSATPILNGQNAVNTGGITIAGTGYASSTTDTGSGQGATIIGDISGGNKTGRGGYIAGSAGTPVSVGGQDGGIRIIWGTGRSYPSNAA